MSQCLIFSAYLQQCLCLQQKVQVHMHQADSDRYLRFLGRFRIVCTQYGSHLVWGLSFFLNSSIHYKTNIILPEAEDCLLLSIDCAMWILL
jgi:hypothetical protein